MQKKNLIWDLSGTLFKPSTQGMNEEEIADYSLIFYMWSGKKERSRLDELAFQVLSLLGEQPTDSAQEIIRLHTGVPLPEIMCAYLAGRSNSAQALEETLPFFDSWARQHHLSHVDTQQVRRILQTFFNPQSLATCMKPIKETVELMERSGQKNPHYILSNWDHDSFIPFNDKYKESALAPFTQDRITISADTGFVKPQRAIYEWFLEHHKLDPSTCLFFDDQEENVEAALAVGIEALHVRLHDLEPIKEHLTKAGLI